MATNNRKQTGSSIATLEQSSLTDLQKAFVVQFVSVHGDGPKAAALAGISKEFGLKCLKNPVVLEAIRKFVLMEFQADAVKARSVLIEVMEDVESPAMVRRQCAIDVLQMASLDLPWTGGGDSLGNLDTSKLSEFEKDELERMLAKMQPDPTSEAEVEGEVIENGE